MYKKLGLILPLCLMLGACAHFGGYHHGTTEETEGTMTEHGQPYLKADRSLPTRTKLKRQCLDDNGHQVCGYDCKRVGGQVTCAQDADQRCVVDHGTGRVVCGYDCKVTSNEARCGKYRYDNCVTNSYGDIRCGNNCYEREDGELACGK